MAKKTDETTTPQPLGGAETAKAAPTTDEEADRQAAESGWLQDKEIKYFTQRTKKDLEREGNQPQDIARAERVLKIAGLKFASESYYKAYDEAQAAAAAQAAEEEAGG